MSSLAEAVAARAAHPDWMLLAGGTDLMVTANHRPVPAGIIDIWRMPGGSTITATPSQVTIGASSASASATYHADSRSSRMTTAAGVFKVTRFRLWILASISSRVGRAARRASSARR